MDLFRSTVLTAASLLILALLSYDSAAQTNATTIDADRQRITNDKLAAPNPLDPGESLWIEKLTYIEVRDLISAGYTTAIIPTGGIEENGPYLVTGKHNVILRSLCPAIAVSLGNTLCAPIVAFVPEGNIDPPSGAMRFPGSFSVRDETYHALLEDIASSLKQHGFRDIVMIGDSGGNQRGMAHVAETLNERWAGSGVAVHYVAEFYTPGWEATEQYAEKELGVAETQNDGYHDDIWVTAMMMVSDPASVRYRQRVDADLASINGVDISSLEETVELGRKMVRFRAEYTANAVRASIDGNL
jgi:creatinine amidohydrolase/Fe(II)-dependent formamide hydrolase-like protein